MELTDEERERLHGFKTNAEEIADRLSGTTKGETLNAERKFDEGIQALD